MEELGLGLPDLAKTKTWCPVQLEFQINKQIFVYVYPKQYLGDIYTKKKLFIVYMKLKFNCISCILFGNSGWDGSQDSHGFGKGQLEGEWHPSLSCFPADYLKFREMAYGLSGRKSRERSG